MPTEEYPPNLPPNPGSDGRRSTTPNESTIAPTSAWQTPHTSVPIIADDLLALQAISTPAQAQNALASNASSLYPQLAPAPARSGQGHVGLLQTSPDRGCTARFAPEAVENGVQDIGDRLAESMIVCPGSANSPRSTPSPKRPSRSKNRKKNPLHGPMTAPSWHLGLRDAQLALGQYQAVFPNDFPHVGNPTQQSNPSPYPQYLNDADFLDRELQAGGDTKEVHAERGREEAEEDWDMCDDADGMPEARSRM